MHTSIALVTVAAFALSFQSLMKLGELAGYGGLAWLYPLCVDLGTVSSCTAWLATRSRQAFWMTWSLLAISVLQNGTVHWLIATGQKPEWWLITLVATVPPCVLGLTVHLGVTLGRAQSEQTRQEREAAGKAAQRASERAEAKQRVAAPKAEPAKAQPETSPPSGKRKPSEPAKRAQAVAEQHISEVGKLPSVRELERKAGVSRNLSQRTLTALRVTPAVEEVRRNGSPVSV